MQIPNGTRASSPTQHELTIKAMVFKLEHTTRMEAFKTEGERKLAHIMGLPPVQPKWRQPRRTPWLAGYIQQMNRLHGVGRPGR